MEDNKYEEIVFEDVAEKVENEEDYEYETGNGLGKLAAVGAAGLIVGGTIVKLVPKGVKWIKNKVAARKTQKESNVIQISVADEEESKN